MAETEAMNSMYLRLGFSISAALMMRVDQGMENLDELELLSDIEVEALCKLVRRPGGHIMNLNAAGAGQPEFIPVQGSAISMHSFSNLKHACFLFIIVNTQTGR